MTDARRPTQAQTSRTSPWWWVLWGVGFVAVLVGSEVARARHAPTNDGVTRPPVLRQGEAERAQAEVPGTLGAGAYGPGRQGTAVYPVQSIPLEFNHGQHLAQGMMCSDCHTAIASSRRSRDYNFPTGNACDRCHGEQHPPTPDVERKCSTCHTKVEEGRVTETIRAPRPLLHFNHALHAREGATCERCHGDMSKVRLATRLQLPREAVCLECHDGFQATQRCGACHPTHGSGQLMTRAMDRRAMPALVPRGDSSWGMEHDLAFVEDHAGIAKANAETCRSCHDDTFCTDCHAGSIRPLRLHPGDYITTHALDARARTQDCQSCHRTQTFCLGCHERLGFGERDRGEFGVGGALAFHPDGWAGPAGTPQGHAHAAQRNMAACASCHSEDSCLACHATTAGPTPGWGVSPHGRGFGASARCSALVARNRRVCLKCHAPGDPNLECL